MTIPSGDRWRFVNNYLTTCLEDGTITLNSRIVAEVVSDSINPQNKALISAAPDLLEALQELLKFCPESEVDAASRPLYEKMKAAVNKATKG